MIKADVIIIGGGLSGLAVADELTREGRSWILLEARERLGGRILSLATDHSSQHCFDLGPSWIWPHNERMLKACDRFGLNLFEQNSEGNLVFQDDKGVVRRDLAFSTMAGALRMDGGVATLVERLAQSIPDDHVYLGHGVQRLQRQSDRVDVEALGPDGLTGFSASSVVLALPPRIIAETISFEPELPQAAYGALCNVPTWMAGHAKAVAVYDRPFWCAEGLSGDAISHLGPMVEVHDASPMDGAVGALFGFIGTPAPARLGQEKELRNAIIAQLTKLFGDGCAKPTAFFYKDWAFQPETATTADHKQLGEHPVYGLPPALIDLWDGALIFAGSEVANVNGGFLEGALEAAQTAVSKLTKFGQGTEL